MSSEPGDIGVSESFPTDLLPVVGFDRNQPFRRALGHFSPGLSIQYRDPAVIYHMGAGCRVTRFASVEKWLVESERLFPGVGSRNFWERIWNLAVTTWDWIDTLGGEPWRPPSPFHPFLPPSAWRPFKWNRLLFSSALDFVREHANGSSEFISFADSLVRFQFGRGLEELPLGMASLALNAPSESYRIMGRLFPPNEVAAPPEGAPATTAWTATLETRGGLAPDPVPAHQVFLEETIAGLGSRAVVLARGEGESGVLFVRTVAPTSDPPRELAKSVADQLISMGVCEGVRLGEVRPSETIWVRDAAGWKIVAQEVDWPWLGPVRGWVGLMRE